ncbi:MAG: metallophosphoesterase [Acidobacteria bacterium]|nr:metallophosphoesterase [Acidobacteriota bacterium]
MKIVHFADLHLDSAFAWAGADGQEARKRRRGLQQALDRIAGLTREVAADALFCGGDLYEHQRVTPDTAQFLRSTFEALAPLPVYVAPGNHDWYGPQSLYAGVAWSANVHIFREARLQAVPLGDGVTLWGAAHCQPANTGNFFEGFTAHGPGVHIALCHAAESSWLDAQEEGKALHAPFDEADIARAGVTHAFMGHYHQPKAAPRHTYPGNPDPLAFGEEGRRGPVVAAIKADGSVERDWHVVAVTETHDLALEVTGCSSQRDVLDRLAGIAAGRSGLARVTVGGELSQEVDLHTEDLRSTLLDRFDAVQVRTGSLRSGYDIQAVRTEQTVRGQFVRDVLEAELAEDERRRVLTTGLRALEGRSDLEVL